MTSLPTYPVPKSNFQYLESGVAHFAGGGQTPLPNVATETFNAFARRKAMGQMGYKTHLALVEETRITAAKILSAEPRDIAFVGSASDGIARVVQAIDWQEGDNAVMSDVDYASGRAALLRLATQGVSLREVPAHNWICPEESLIAACDDRTRMVYVSQVNARTGQRMNVARLHAALSPRGIIVLNDATHALGALPVRAGDADVTVSSCYKFLCASFMGMLCTGSAAGRALMPAGAGWYSVGADDARRYEYGNPPHLDVAILRDVLDWHLEVGSFEQRERYVLAVADKIEMILTAAGFGVVSRKDQRGSHNVCVMAGPIAGLAQGLEEQGIRVWFDPGRLRFSAQIFNDAQDLEKLAAAIQEVAPKLEWKEIDQ